MYISYEKNNFGGIMKSKDRRKNETKFLDENAILILCRNCNVYSKCNKKNRKEANERQGIRTFCTLSPNKNKKTLGKLTKK